MQIELMYAKLHRATVTDANLNYVGSITIDEDLMDAAHIREFQKVDVVDINNGERLSTYVIKGQRGKLLLPMQVLILRRQQNTILILSSWMMIIM